MARTVKRSRSKRKEPRPKNLPSHAFWSGSLTFGLVNMPVLVFPASRHSAVRLRMISRNGSPLERRFFCPRHRAQVPADEIVRGYELDDGSYITVSDDELEAIEPQKTREIDLRQFIDLAELPPVLFERGYYLAPLKEATKAYRLLAEAMERTRQAGIATFVMREREYLVPIYSRNGILCAETLRFRDEIRDPQSIGLPAPAAVVRKRVAELERSIGALMSKTLARDELADESTRALLAIIEKNKKAGRGLIRADHDGGGLDSDGEGGVDLLETIRRSLRHPHDGSPERRRRAEPARNGQRGRRTRKSVT
jgi:DNA end-binding protein Ku